MLYYIYVVEYEVITLMLRYLIHIFTGQMVIPINGVRFNNLDILHTLDLIFMQIFVQQFP